MVVLCRQTACIWYKILYDWSKKSLTLHYRFGKIHNVISNGGSNLIPRNLNQMLKLDGEERKLIDLVHNQAPVEGQYSNTVESRIKLVKQCSREMIGKVKGQKYKPLH